MTDNAWVFPLGHYLGPFFPDSGGPMESHQIRFGQSVTNLFTEAEFAIWALAHGLPSQPGQPDRAGPTRGRPWSRGAIAAAVRERGGEFEPGTDVETVLAELIADGALVEVEPGTADALAFAQGHRFQALLTGLGASDERPDLFQIGVTGHPMVTVDELAFELWEWGPLHPSLLAACEALATADGVAPEELLSPLFARLHALLAGGAGYLDVAASR